MTGPTAPTLLVGTYVLRPLAMDDLPDIARLAPHDQQMRRWSSIGQVTDPASAEAWLRSRLRPGRLEWSVRDERGELAGRVALHGIDLEDGVAEIGYGLFEAHRGRGAARAVVREVTLYGFAELGLRRVELVHAVENERSCRLATACGYALEGVMRQALDDHVGGWEDAHLHARLASDPVS